MNSPVDNAVKMTFYFTYVMLITTGTITFIEALRTKNPTIRHIMNIETCISIIAAYFYGQFIEKLHNGASYDELSITRYTDWFISTPFMLLVLCMFLSYEHHTDLRVHVFFIIILLNFGMLTSGYLGETNHIDKRTALGVGFLFFAALFGYIWANFMIGDDSSHPSFVTFMVFVIVWGLYGIVYVLPAKYRNVSYNILDLIAKCLVGIFFWMYFTGVVVL
jgi:bacteriorhodopsin